MPDFRILSGDALAMLRTLPDESVHCCLTSPPERGAARARGGAGEDRMNIKYRWKCPSGGITDETRLC